MNETHRDEHYSHAMQRIPPAPRFGYEITDYDVRFNKRISFSEIIKSTLSRVNLKAYFHCAERGNIVICRSVHHCQRYI